MHKIIVTGPESSGKTKLCEDLSKHFKIPFNKEYAREYLNNLNRKYIKEDLLKIAKEQLQSEINSQLLDTDLITIKIWSEHKYKHCNKWIIKQIQKKRSVSRFYLLCKPDIPWQADPLRENSINRNEIFEIYKRELEKLKHDFFIIEGENRLKKSISNISHLIL